MEGEHRSYERIGHVSSEGRVMAVGSSWSCKPPRGSSIVEGNLVGRGRSRAGVSCANRTAEWGWTDPAPSPALARTALDPPLSLPFLVGPLLRRLTRSRVWAFRRNQAAARRRPSWCSFSDELPEPEDPRIIFSCLFMHGHVSTSPCSTGFCFIRDCISSSSSSGVGAHLMCGYLQY